MSRLLLTAVLVLAALAGPAAAQQPTYVKVSVNAAGEPGNGGSDNPDISADGRFVAFLSSATNLAPGDTNGRPDIFVRDRMLGETRRISVGPGGAQSDGDVFAPDMSADGRRIVFMTNATTLASPPSSGVQSFLWDAASQALRQLLPPAGYQSVYTPAISADGTRVAYRASGPGGIDDVFVVDAAGGAPRRISQLANGSRPNGGSYVPKLSGDGRWVAYVTLASNLVDGDTNGFNDVIAEHVDTRERIRASVGAGGGQPNNHAQVGSVDDNGCRIAFHSTATNMIAADDGTGNAKAWVRDRCAGETELLSIDDAGTKQGWGHSPLLSSDGCLALFTTSTAIVAPPPAGGTSALALRNRCRGATTRIDVAPGGGAASNSGFYAFSPGTARHVAFGSYSANLVPGDPGLPTDVFVRDRGGNAGPTARLTVTDLGGGRFRADASGSTDPDGYGLTGTIAWDDGGGPVGGLAAEHVFARGGAHTVTATITDADGATATASQTVDAPAPPAPPGSGTDATPAPVLVDPGGGPTTRRGSRTPRPGDPDVAGDPGGPRLDRVALSRRSFGVVPRGRRPSGRRGAALSLRLSADATVSLVFRRTQPGRRSGTRCVPGRRRGTRCTRVTSAGTLTQRLAAGTRQIALTGRVGSRTLARGTYQLVLSARTADGLRSGQRTLSFTITAGR